MTLVAAEGMWIVHNARDVLTIYRRAHRCNNVAHRAQLMLMTRLKNQSEFTQTEYLGGENGGGLATEEGVEERVTFGSARIS